MTTLFLLSDTFIESGTIIVADTVSVWTKYSDVLTVHSVRDPRFLVGLLQLFAVFGLSIAASEKFFHGLSSIGLYNPVDAVVNAVVNDTSNSVTNIISTASHTSVSLNIPFPSGNDKQLSVQESSTTTRKLKLYSRKKLNELTEALKTSDQREKNLELIERQSRSVLFIVGMYCLFIVTLLALFPNALKFYFVFLSTMNWFIIAYVAIGGGVYWYYKSKPAKLTDYDTATWTVARVASKVFFRIGSAMVLFAFFIIVGMLLNYWRLSHVTGVAYSEFVKNERSGEMLFLVGTITMAFLYIILRLFFWNSRYRRFCSDKCTATIEQIKGAMDAEEFGRGQTG